MKVLTYMLAGNLNQPETYQLLLKQPIWNQALAWLKDHQSTPPADGEYEIQGQDMRAIVQTVATQPRANRAFEAHQREIDLHYCFEGSELIEWISVSALTAQTKYDNERDFTLYNVLSNTTSIYMTPGTFAIFLPADAHLPAITAQHPEVRKAVIKINTAQI